jgi:dTDP-4-dehydrorhamnose reductase
MRGNNFVTKVLEWAKKSKEIRVVDDQISNATWARTLAEITANMIAMGIKDIRTFFKDKGGIYHCAGSGYCSRYEWAKFILEYSGIRNVNVLPAKSNDFAVLADRPYFSALDINKFKNSFGLVLPYWKVNLKLSLV